MQKHSSTRRKRATFSGSPAKRRAGMRSPLAHAERRDTHAASVGSVGRGVLAIARVPNRKIAPYVQVMSTESKRGEGAAEELGGTIKKVAGKVLGNEQMEAEGKAKELAGEAKQEAAKAAGRTEGKVEEVVGAVKNRIGQVIDNEQMAAEGKAKELKGEAKQKANE